MNNNIITPSVAEVKIIGFLQGHGIRYVREAELKDLVNPLTGKALRVDFFLPDYGIVIEYDGRQHFRYTPKYHGDDPIRGRELVLEQQRRDKIKNDYCKEKGFTMWRLNWTHYHTLQQVLNRALNKFKESK